MQFMITNDTVTVTVDGKPYSVAKGSPTYDDLRKAVLTESWDLVPSLISVAFQLQDWSGDAIRIVDDNVHLDGEVLIGELHDRVLRSYKEGKSEDLKAIVAFLRRLRKNPNPHSVQQLWGFLAHKNIPLQPDGTFLGYKSVRSDFKDWYANAYDNSPGQVVTMPRQYVSTDPEVTCGPGLHVGTLAYAQGFISNATIVLVEVDPEDVCRVPRDHEAQKLAVCRYKVVSVFDGTPLPSTVRYPDPEDDFEVEEDTEVEEDLEVEVPVVSQQVKERKKVEKIESLNTFSLFELAEVPLGILRSYAAKCLGIVGASKLPGGKENLLTTIVSKRPDLQAAIQTGAVSPPEPEPEPVKPSTGYPLTGTPWDHFNALDSFGLYDQNITELRKYAAQNCGISGASKLPGGKVELVKQICKNRGMGWTE